MSEPRAARGVAAIALPVALFGLVLIAAIWGVVFKQVHDHHAEAVAGEFRKNANLAIVHEAHVLRTLQDADLLLRIIKEQVERSGAPPDLKKWASAGIVKAGSYNYIGVTNERGDIVAASRDFALDNLADRDFFRFHQRDAASVLRIGDPFLSRATGRWGIPLTRRIDKPDGSFGGVVEVVVDTGFFTGLFQSLDLGPTDILALVREDGIILIRRNGQKSTFGENVKGSNLMLRQRTAGVGSYLAEGVLDHRVRFFSYRTLKDHALIVAVGTGEAEVLAPVRRRAMHYYASAAAASLLILALCALAILALARQRRATAVLRESEQSLSTTLNSIADGVIAADMAGHITRMNPVAEKLTGWALADAIGRPSAEVFRIVQLETRAVVESPVLQVLASGETVRLAAGTALLAKDGREYRIADRAAPIRNAAGRTSGVVLVFSDVTESERVEGARATLEGQLRESQKMEAIGTLAGGIAHDFNNIISIILGNTAIAREEAHASAATLESLEEIRKAGVRARDLVQQILSFSRRQPAERKLLSLGAVIDESVRLLRAVLPPRLTLVVQHDAAVPQVLADFSQMQQVVINLVTNSMQAMRSGPGHIGIRLDAVIPDAAVAVPALAAMVARHPGRAVRLTFSDTGPGMDAQTLARLFEPFFTTKPLGEGTGLGLSVVHGIVQAHDGAIVVESQPGQGTTFTLYLPAAESAAPAGASAAGAAARPVADVSDGLRLLYIDDDESLVFLIKRLLARRGYRVSGYTHAKEALAVLRTDPSAFDLVVTDYNMPGMSGLDVARAVRDIRADLPVAIASGLIAEELRAQAAAAGVRELIFKATAVEDLCEALARLARSVDGDSTRG